MNGFANVILKLLLGWLRSLADAVWALFGSDGGGAMLAFLRTNWKIIFLILCVGGFVVDRVVYLIRWRPYYVWRARRAHRRHGWEDEPQHEGYTPPYSAGYYPAEQPYPPADAAYSAQGDPYPPQATARYTPPQRFAGDAPTYRYAPPERLHTDSYPADRPYPQGPTQPYGQQAAPEPQPQRYGDLSAYTPGDLYAPTAAFQPIRYDAPTEPEPFEGEPLFDDDLAQWNAPDNTFADFAPRLTPENNPAYGMDSAFGAPQPEPAQYLRDVQAGFAPQPAPEQRYAPQREPAAPQSMRADAPAAEPVHPGLDVETFQQNIGLTNGIATTGGRPADAYTDFAPFAAVVQPDSSPQGKSRGLGALAKKARTLVSGEDERNPRTIRDLQPAVDVKSAVRAPVYPRTNPESEDDA